MSEARARRAVHMLRARLGLTEQEAEFVLRLYEARGAVVPHYEMDDALTPHWPRPRKSGFEHITAVACRVRKKLGPEAFINNHLAYSMTDAGLRRVSEALQPEPEP